MTVINKGIASFFSGLSLMVHSCILQEIKNWTQKIANESKTGNNVLDYIIQLEPGPGRPWDQ